MKVAGVQCDLAWEDPGRNFERLVDPISRAASSGARLVALPEMFPTGFSMASTRISEEPGGPAERFLVEQAARWNVTLVGSVATRQPAGGKPLNLGLVVFPDGRVERYAKVHPFSLGGEHEHYDRGGWALTVEVEGVRVSVAICYDLRFCEMFVPLAPRTDLFCVVANWPEVRRDHWRTLLKARSIDCLAYVLGVNRVGTGGENTYTGDSALWAPGGELLAEARPGVEELISGDVDLTRVVVARKRFPVLDDRRPEFYRKL